MPSPRLLMLLLMLGVSPSALAQEAVDAGPPDIQAEDFRDVMSARSLGMGGAFRALGMGSEAVVGNPAALALYKAYRVEFTGAWDWSQKHGQFGATILDSSTSGLATGLDYRLVSVGRGSQRRTGHLGTLAFGVALAPGLYVGTSARYLLQRGVLDIFDTSAPTVDAGLLVAFSEGFTLGFSGHNLVDTGNPELTRYYSGHLGLMTGVLTVAADVRADFTTGDSSTLTYSGGLEYVLSQAFPVRVGYTYDGFTGASRLGLGVGLLTPGGGLDLAYRHDFGGPQGRMLALTLKLQVR